MSKTEGAAAGSKAVPEVPFEEAMKRLESIVKSMEMDDLPLEKVISFYEEGTKFAQICQAKLAEADLKIQQVEKNSAGKAVAKPFSLPDESQRI